MQPLHVLLLQSDSGTSDSLLASFCNIFELVRQAPCLEDLREYLVKNPKGIVVVDMEVASLFDVERLSHDFPEVRIICNHRLADEQMWTQTLNAGAADCCPSYDTRGILRAAMQEHSARPMAA
jgi:hypothetical protein